MIWPWQYLRLAREQLDKAQQDDPRVNEVAETSARIKEQNGFLRAIDHALGRTT